MKLKLFGLILISFTAFGQSKEQTHEEHINSLYLKHLQLLKEPGQVNQQAQKSVSFVAPGQFKYTIKQGQHALVFVTDYEYGELSYEKTYQDRLYQSGKLFFENDHKGRHDLHAITDFGTVTVNDFSAAKGSCGGRLSTLNEIMDLMEDLIDSGVDPQSDLIGNLMQAAFTALRDLMTCMQR